MRHALLAVLLLAAPAQAAWFDHPFGERRAYWTDWLAVCADAGRGACRLVQAAGDEARLALTLTGEGGYVLTLFDRAMTDTPLPVVTLSTEDASATLPAQPGEVAFDDALRPFHVDAAQTVTLHGPGVDALVPALMRGTTLAVRFPGGARAYSLRGITAGLLAIEEAKGLVGRAPATRSRGAKPAAPFAALGVDGVMQGLPGLWRSLDDPADTMEISMGSEGLVRTFRHDGVRIAPPDALAWAPRCPYAAPAIPEGVLVAGRGGDALCYAVLAFDGARLDLGFVGGAGGAPLRFERVD